MLEKRESGPVNLHEIPFSMIPKPRVQHTNFSYLAFHRPPRKAVTWSKNVTHSYYSYFLLLNGGVDAVVKISASQS